jgi:hypothetical protein
MKTILVLIIILITSTIYSQVDVTGFILDRNIMQQQALLRPTGLNTPVIIVINNANTTPSGYINTTYTTDNIQSYPDPNYLKNQQLRNWMITKSFKADKEETEMSYPIDDNYYFNSDKALEHILTLYNTKPIKPKESTNKFKNIGKYIDNPIIKDN